MMSVVPFENQIRKEEALYSKQIVYFVNKALQNKKTISAAQPSSKDEGKQAPKLVKAVYTSAAHREIAKIQKKYPSMQIHADLTYKKIQKRWMAVATITATYNMRKVGGKTHQIKNKETLWSISKDNYGSGIFWTVLEDYNKHLKTKGKYLRAGVKIHVPQIDVIEKICVPATVKGSDSAPVGAMKPAVDISYPNVVLKYSKKKTVSELIKAPGATLKLTLSISGELSVSKKDVIPLDFDVRKYKSSVESAGKYFTDKFSISDFNFKNASISVSNKASGSQWKTSFSFKMDGTVTVSMSRQSISFKHKGLDYSGTIDVTLDILYIPDLYLPEKRARWKQYGDWVSDNQLAVCVAFATLPVAAATLTATAASAVVVGAIKWTVGLVVASTAM